MEFFVTAPTSLATDLTVLGETDPFSGYCMAQMTGDSGGNVSPASHYTNLVKRIVESGSTSTATARLIRDLATKALASQRLELENMPCYEFEHLIAEIGLQMPPEMPFSVHPAYLHLKYLGQVASGRFNPLGTVEDFPSRVVNPHDVTSCKVCEKHATNRCGGCAGAPDVTDDSVYCSVKCQKADWAKHRAECKVLQSRKAIYRAAEMLKYLFHLYQWRYYPTEIVKVESKNGVLYVFTDHRKMTEVAWPCKKIPEDIMDKISIADGEAVLSVQGSCGIVALMHIMTEMFLSDICSDVRECRLRVINAPRPTAVVDFYGRTRNKMLYDHALLRITSQSGEVFAFDITGGAAFGWTEPAIPWARFSHHRLAHSFETADFGTWHAEFFAQMPGDNFKQVQGIQRLQLTDTVRDWVKENNMSLKTLVKLPNVDFEQKRKAFYSFVGHGFRERIAKIEKLGWYKIVLHDGEPLTVELTLERDEKKMKAETLLRVRLES
ncbi:hypothetical protein M8818_000318 [Zalaria obscura]|uniref:Uncharacterized protein n=1 Tax=Zalaria obscura TaxID=2024903 RepID=A0ACC3SR70_9PEZI